MALSQRTGKAVRMASGSVSYLLHIAKKSLQRGRKWIELSSEPASQLTFPRPRRKRGSSDIAADRKD